MKLLQCLTTECQNKHSGANSQCQILQADSLIIAMSKILSQNNMYTHLCFLAATYNLKPSKIL